MAELWSLFQLASASLDRISEVISMESDMKIVPQEDSKETVSIIEFENVVFRYPETSEILKGVSFSLQKGMTYALVGPTGG